MSSDVFEQTSMNFDNRKSSTMTDSLLRVENVVASYGKKEILQLLDPMGLASPRC